MGTKEQHRRMEINLKCKITKLKNKSKNPNLLLNEKVSIHREVKKLRLELRDHILNYHNYIGACN